MLSSFVKPVWEYIWIQQGFIAISRADVCTAVSSFHASAFSCHPVDLIRHFPKSTIPHMTYHFIIKKESVPSPTLITLPYLLSCLTNCLSVPLALAETLLAFSVIGSVAWSIQFLQARAWGFTPFFGEKWQLDGPYSIYNLQRSC